jgi:hypothetical protein
MATPSCIRTLRLKVKAEAYAWLNAAAIEVNQVWNFANATGYYPCSMRGGACSRRNCSTKASRPADAFKSSMKETLRENAAAAGPSRVLRVGQARCEDMGMQCVSCEARSERKLGPKYLVCGEASPVRLREQVISFSRAAEPDIPSMRGHGSAR